MWYADVTKLPGTGTGWSLSLVNQFNPDRCRAVLQASSKLCPLSSMHDECQLLVRLSAYSKYPSPPFEQEARMAARHGYRRARPTSAPRARQQQCLLCPRWESRSLQHMCRLSCLANCLQHTLHDLGHKTTYSNLMQEVNPQVAHEESIDHPHEQASCRVHDSAVDGMRECFG